MKEPRDHLPRDLKALRYLDALNAGDLEAVAVLWEEASHDPELERILAEVDGALFAENSTTDGNAGAECLSGFLAKELPATRRRRAAWVGVAGALAAACVVAGLAWSTRDSKAPGPSPGTSGTAQQVTLRAPDDFASVPAWPGARRVVGGAEMPTFHWPLPETSPITLSTSIAPDWLD